MSASSARDVARNLMFVSSSDLEDLVAKGVADMLLERDEGAFFNSVVSVHPWARKTRTVVLSPSHRLEEMGHDRVKWGARSRTVRRLMAPYLVLDSVLRMRTLIRKAEISIIRASDPFWTATAAWLASWGTDATFTVSIHADWRQRHALDPTAVPRVFGSFAWAERLASFNLNRADGVIIIRESLRPLLKRWGVRGSEVLLMPHVVDDELFETDSRSAAERRRDTPYVFFAGRLSNENYVLDVLAAFERVAREVNFDLVVAGDGPAMDILRSRLEASSLLSKRVELLGFIPREEVPEWRRGAAANLCLMGGYSLIEACASARPVIAYDVEWHHELVRPFDTGFLIEEGSIEEVARALRFIATNPGEADEMGMRARNLARQRHGRANAVAHRQSMYAQLMSTRGRNGRRT